MPIGIYKRKSKKIKVICRICNKPFKIYPCIKYTAKYCSRQCYYKSLIGLIGEKSPSWKGGEIKKKCLICNNEFFVRFARKDKAKYCSYKCYWKALKKYYLGDKACGWKGGRTKSNDGYILVHKPNHPFCNKQGYIREHRLVVEKYLNRYLTPKEKVHHKGIKYPIDSIENKQDNRLENLMVFISIGYHRVFHRWGYYNSKYIIFDGGKI